MAKMPHKKSNTEQNIKAIILAGSRDFGRCPLLSRLPTALWLVAGKPAIEQLLLHLWHHGIKHATICSNGDASLIRKNIGSISSMELKFLDESLPVGTAGCIRDAADGDTNSLLLVFPAGITSPPNVDTLVRAHRSGKSELTVALEPVGKNDGPTSRPSEIYVCRPSILEYIPQEGFCDIKETLIPALLGAGKTVHSVRLTQSVGNFRDRSGYLLAIARYLENSNSRIGNPPTRKSHTRDGVWISPDAKVDPSTRIYGDVAIMDGAVVARDAVIFGPSIIGKNVSVGQGSLIAGSVLWPGANIGANCELRECLVEHKANVPNGKTHSEQIVLADRNGILHGWIDRAVSRMSKQVSQARSLMQTKIDRMNQKLPNWTQSKKLRKTVWPIFGVSLVFAAFLWSYWPTVADLWKIWGGSDEYSSGLLVPFLAVYLIWSRRADISQSKFRPSLWGLLAFLAAQGFRYFGLFFMYGSAVRLSLVLSIASLVLLLFGWQRFRKLAPILLFLLLMLPLPKSFEARITLPLQNWATSSAVFSLETLGYEVTREGNIIHLGETTVAVAEACNGLRMVTSFFVISGLVILLVKRAWWEKLILLLSTLPIGLLCNTVRLTVTSIAFTMLKGEHWEGIFHDFGGYAMMPLALAMVVFELWILTKMTTVPEDNEKEQKANILITRSDR